MVKQYVEKLLEHMGGEAENHQTCHAADVRTLLRNGHYDLLHLHGCWQSSARGVVATALRQGTRLVFSPHGQLEPWVMSHHYLKEKLPKQMLFQKQIVSTAYAVIIEGRMEEECMRRLGWNPRTIIIRNALITNSTSFPKMVRQTLAVYRQVMDSNTRELMSDDTRTLLVGLLKAGICSDPRWLGDTPLPHIGYEDWRRLLCHAHQEQVDDVVAHGLRVMRLESPDIDASAIPYFLPEGYEPPTTINQSIGMQFATENERLLATFQYLRRMMLHGCLTLLHMVELDKELRLHDTEEDLLCDTLRDHKLYNFAARIMWMMKVLTGFDEGFMPMPPQEDRIARRMLKQVENHLKI